jgi:S-adenosylmethionine-diacylglycerol 3-amino-3-carboxypropyl transferase
MKKQLDNVKHDYIRYANCWEDPDVLLEALKIENTDKVLSIGSAGDNSFSILSQSPALVVAVDINAVQLNLIELKKAAFKELNHQEFLAFLGFSNCNDRTDLYQRVSNSLSSELKDFWDARFEEIQAGIIYQGKFERYFKLFRTKILPLVHTKKRVNLLFEDKTAEQQLTFFNKRWNNLRWRLLFKLFFSKLVMGRFGRDPAFLKEVEVPVSEFIIGKAKQHLSNVRAQKNYFLHFIMKGTFGDGLPHYARKEHYDTIKNNIDRLIEYNGLAEDAFKEYSGFTKFNLSNIFEYMDIELFTAVTNNLVENGSSASRYAYWNLMVPRVMSEVNDQLDFQKELSEKMRIEDKGFFYAGINVDVKK